MRKKKCDLFTVLTESQRLKPCYKLLAFYLEIQVWLDPSGAERQQETQRRQQIIKKQQHCSTLLGFMGRVHVLSPVFYNSSPGTSEPTDRQQAQLQRANPSCILLPLQAPALGLVSTIFCPHIYLQWPGFTYTRFPIALHCPLCFGGMAKRHAEEASGKSTLELAKPCLAPMLPKETVFLWHLWSKTSLPLASAPSAVFHLWNGGFPSAR